MSPNEVYMTGKRWWELEMRKKSGMMVQDKGPCAGDIFSYREIT